MLVDSTGTGLVTDFGLAKRLAASDGSFTETGQVLGTPKYMAPEQAAGGKDLTVAADVYSLGVILYERLTGRTPFTGENALTVLRQARESEPPRPSSIRPGLDRDLETVVLKCLEKEPGRRYPSAGELADDLARWLKGEPIAARPVRWFEKAWLWTRRNPALATAGGLAAAGLVAAAVISSIAAFQAQARAKAERERREIADQAKMDSDTARDRFEQSAARSLVGPFDALSERTSFGQPEVAPLTDTEVERLWELAEERDDRLRMRFLYEAIRDPMAVRQLLARAEPALIAAVGLDSMRRDRAAKLLADRFLDPKLGTPAHRADVALIALELEDQAGAATRDCTATVIEAAAASQPGSGASDWQFHMTHNVARLEPNTLAQMLAQIKVRNPIHVTRGLFIHVTRGLLEGDGLFGPLVETVAERLDPAEAERIVQMLSAALVREKDKFRKIEFEDVLISIMCKKAPARAIEMLSDRFRRLFDDDWGQEQLDHLVESLYGFDNYMPQAEACRLYDMAGHSLAAAREREKDATKRRILAHSLTDASMFFINFDHYSSLMDRMTPTEAAKVCDQVARLVLEDLSEAKVSDLYQPALFNRPADSGIPRWNLSIAAATIVERMRPGEAGKVASPAARVLADAVEKTTDAKVRRAIALDLTRVTSRLSTTEAAKICGRVGQVLTAALEKETHDEDRLILASGLACIAVRLTPSDAASAVGLVARTAARHESNDLSDLFAFLGQKPTPSDASRAARLILAALELERDPNTRWCLVTGLALVAVRMEPADVTRISGPALPRLLTAMQQKEERWVLQVSTFSDALKVVADCDPRQAAQAARALIAELRKPDMDGFLNRQRLECLRALADHTPVEEAAQIARVLAAALIRKPADSFRWLQLETFTKLANRMTPADAARISQVIADALADEKDWDTCKPLLKPLISLANRMTPTEAAKVRGRVARMLIVPGNLARMAKMPHPEWERQSLASDLVSLASPMEPEEANWIFREVIRSLLQELQAPDDSIVQLLPQLDPSTARELARELALRACSDNKLWSDSLWRGGPTFNETLSARLNAILTDVGRTPPAPQPAETKAGDQKPPSTPLPCRLTTPELVELLKMPTCFGAARRVVLDHLGNRYGRRFVNHWAFVRVAREQGLDFDFTTTPKRPKPKETVERMLKILDRPDHS